MKFTFGKYKGVDVSEVPLSYLAWAYENADHMGFHLKEAVRLRLGVPASVDRRGPSARVDGSHDLQRFLTATKLAVQDCYRDAARRHHPDHGGSTEAMVGINDLAIP